MLAKLCTIIKSRFKKETGEAWVRERREVCKNCDFNDNNSLTRSFKLKVYKVLSNLLSYITRSKMERLGFCQCGCPIAEKTAEITESCWSKEEYGVDYWESIYIPNSSNSKNGKII